MYLGTASRIQATARQRDPNDGVTVVWVLGLETHPRLKPQYHYTTIRVTTPTTTSPHLDGSAMRG